MSTPFDDVQDVLICPDYMKIQDPNRYFTTACLRSTGAWPRLGTNFQYKDAMWVVVGFKETPESSFAKLTAQWARFDSIEEYRTSPTKKPYVSGQNLDSILNERCLGVKETRAKYDGRLLFP